MKFGTDGVRGRVGVDLTVDDAHRLGRAVGRILAVDREVVVGGDTRRSTPELEDALVAGLILEGCRVIRLGVAPTPMIAYHASLTGAVGVVVSASHNPYHDNGLKVFGVGGTKLSERSEAEIEAELESLADAPEPSVDRRGLVVDRPMARREYLDHLATVLEGRTLDGLKVVIDAANGAASDFVVEAFSAAGAVVEAVNHQPDGVNINVDCGATDPRFLGRAVIATGADVGLALDGDADRLIAVDERGEVVDGDHIIALFAHDLRERQALSGNTVVVTVMTNLGFHHAMRRSGIDVIETPVGDRAVLEALDDGGFALGGEQSGHIIVRHHATTGDGLLSGLILLDLIRRSGRPFSESAAAAMTRLPQLLVNIDLPPLDPDGRRALDELVAAVSDRVAAELGDEGRILIRPSGTEPLLRIMAEAPSEEAARRVVEQVVAELTRGLGALPGRRVDR